MHTTVKKIFLYCTILFTFPFTINAQKNVVDKVVWVVGDEPILLSDVEEARISSEMQGTPVENPYCVIPEQLAIQKLFLHQADLDSIEIDEANLIQAVNEKIDLFIHTYGSKENVETMAHRSLSQFKELQKKMLRDSERMREVQKKITANVKVTPADVREYFKNVPQDSLPFIPTQVEVQIITSTPEVSRQEIERIEDRLREFARRVNDGESDFSTLAMLYSQDGSARMGGELGYNGRNQWVPEFANVAFSLNNPKKVSKIVRTEFGFHIIQLIDKKGDKVNVRHILLKPEIEDSEYTKALTRLDSIVVDIKEGDFTFEDAASVLSDDKDTRNNNGLMFYQDKEKYTRTSRFKMEELPQEIAKVVNNMQIGDISKAFILNNEKGQRVCAVVKLKNRIEGHYANTTEDFQVLKDVVLEKKRNEKIEQWIKDKIQKTYIKIDPEWKNCEFKYSGWIK